MIVIVFRRHPKLAVWHQELTSIARAVGFNKPDVDKFFFHILRTELEKKSVTAERLRNADKRGITVIHRPDKNMVKFDAKQVGKLTCAENWETDKTGRKYSKDQCTMLWNYATLQHCGNILRKQIRTKCVTKIVKPNHNNSGFKWAEGRSALVYSSYLW